MLVGIAAHGRDSVTLRQFETLCAWSEDNELRWCK